MAESERIKEELASEIEYLRAEIAYLTKTNQDLEYQIEKLLEKYENNQSSRN